MFDSGFTDLPLELFGGYSPAIPAADLSPGAAAIAQDVIYPQGAVRSRGGLQNFFPTSAIPANATVNGLKSYVTAALGKRLLAWDSAGNLWKENPQGTLSLVGARASLGAGLFYQSETLFGREYQAFWNSLGGADLPRQFDDTNWDRISQGGPGVAPDVADELASVALLASPNGAFQNTGATTASPNGLTQSGNVVTVTFTGPVTGLTPGSQITIAGATTAAYNGTFRILQVLSTTQVTYINATIGLAGDGGATFTTSIAEFVTASATTLSVGQLVAVAGAGVAAYNGTWKVQQVIDSTHFTVDVGVASLAASGNGTVALAGNIALGLHQVSVAFLTRQGFITQAAPPKSFNASGGKRAVVVNIATGPSNVAARLLLFTPVIAALAVTGNFYSLPNGSAQVPLSSMMIINDNSSTSATVDFTDAILIAGFSCNYLFSQVELGECAFIKPYNARLVCLGERNKISNAVNLTFDGGFGTDSSARKYPLGWTQGANYGGGGSAIAAGFTADWADAYAITGNGATAQRGYISQSAYLDYLGVPIIARNTSYSVRVRVAKAGGLAAGTLHINLNSVSQAFTTAGLAVTAAQAAASYAEFTATLTDAQLASPPSDLLLQIYADGTPTNNGVFLIDSVEIFPTNSPFNYSLARVSHAFNAESYDATTGQIQIRPGDGQQLRAGFTLRSNFYLAKDHYLCYVSDDGVNEPAAWGVNEVSATIGICGPNAVDVTEEWAVFAERSGLYVCWGADPVKITPEIQIDASGTGKAAWSAINWSAAHTLWVRIDKANKMILVGAPINGALTPNVVFMLDYRWLENGQDIAGAPLVTYSAFTGKMLSHGRGRRWATWTITANAMTFAERADGTAQPFFGNGAGNGKIYQQLDATAQPSDDGAAIPWNYQGYGMPTHMEEQQYQLGAHRKLAGYLKFRVIGAGTLKLAISTSQRSTLLRSYTLSTSPAGDGERPLQAHGERFYINLGTNNSASAWFQLEKLVLCMKKDASLPVRGVSA